MADDLQQKVDALIDKIGSAFDALTTLRVQTSVSAMVVSGDGNADWTLTPKAGDAAEGIVTTIKLLEGDISNALSPGALDRAPLMTLHTDQVKLSRQIVSDNLKALLDLARSLTAG